MRSRLLVLFGSTASLACALGLDACSSEEMRAGDTVDASDAAFRDGRFELPEAEARCDPDADLLANVDDAAIADGASTTGLCAGCMRAECPTQLADCARNCPCQAIVGAAVECYLTTHELACLGRLTDYLVTNETRTHALKIVGCVRATCAAPCAVDAGAEGSLGPDDAAARDE